VNRAAISYIYILNKEENITRKRTLASLGAFREIRIPVTCSQKRTYQVRCLTHENVGYCESERQLTSVWALWILNGRVSRVVIERLQAGPSTERYSGSMSCSESSNEKMTVTQDVLNDKVDS
jgi:hypothetical protein